MNFIFPIIAIFFAIVSIGCALYARKCAKNAIRCAERAKQLSSQVSIIGESVIAAIDDTTRSAIKSIEDSNKEQ